MSFFKISCAAACAAILAFALRDADCEAGLLKVIAVMLHFYGACWLLNTLKEEDK